MKERCSGLCEHGDVEYDSDCDPLAYDGSWCHCRRCPNFDVCNAWTPDEMCLLCRSTVREVLVSVGSRECPICASVAPCYLHPARCSHTFCGECLVGMMSARPDQPKPSEYGLVRMCGCEDEDAEWGTHECDECSSLLQEWETTADGVAWAEACIDDDVPADRRCPLCRASPI